MSESLDALFTQVFEMKIGYVVGACGWCVFEFANDAIYVVGGERVRRFFVSFCSDCLPCNFSVDFCGWFKADPCVVFH